MELTVCMGEFMQNENKAKHLIASKRFPMKNLLVINSYITIEAIEKSSVCSELIYLEFYKGYNRETKLPMTMDVMELRGLYYACKELYAKGETGYKNYTNPNLSSSTNNNQGLKKLTIGQIEQSYEKSYILNLEISNDKREITFDKYSFLAFMDSLKVIADETETNFFKAQRQVAKKK
jgi:hypothetical protein